MLCIGSASAQVQFWDTAKPEQRVSFGVRAGLNFSIMSGDDEEVPGLGYRNGFFGGVSADIRVINSFGINTGLFFTQKGVNVDDFGYYLIDGGMINPNPGYEIHGGSRADDVTTLEYRDVHITANFIEIPVYASYRLNFNDVHRAQVFFGPYFDMGVYGKGSCKVNGRKESVSIYDDEVGAHRFQMGLGLGAAYSWRQFSLGLSYQWGLTNIASESGSHWDNFNIALGYNF